MARVAMLEMDQVSGELRDRFQKMEERGFEVLNLFKVMANSPVVGRDFLRLGNSILFKGSVEPRLRELAILRVGNLAKAIYEWTQHVPMARQAGLTKEQIDAIPNWNGSNLFSEQERAVLQYTDEVAETIRVSDDTFQGIKKFLTEEQIVELTTTIGYYGMVSRILEALQVELEDSRLCGR